MGTRGTYGIRKNNEDKTTYNHYDSYPSYLGESIVEFIKKHDNKDIGALYDKLILIDESLNFEDLPDEQKEKLKPYLKRIECKDTNNLDIYWLLRSIQGNLEGYFTNPEVEYMTDGKNFIKDSLFCEYGYIINLDTNMLEIYKGFQKRKCNKGRYGVEFYESGSGDKYYACKLVKEIPLDEVRDDKFVLKNKIKSIYY